MNFRIGDRLFEHAYSAGKYLPKPLRSVSVSIFDSVVGLLASIGLNSISREHEGSEIRFWFFDTVSMLYFLFSIKGNTVHETPFTVFDLPAYFDTAVDVGAHIGSTAVVLGTLNDVELWCFEPNEYNASLLKRNLERNGIAPTIVEKVVSDDTKAVTFYQGANLASNDHTTTPANDSDRSRDQSTVDSTSLSREVDFEGRTTFVKIDVEGEELNVLTDLLRQDASISGVVEVHTDRLEDGEESAERLFDDHGFEHRRIEHARVPMYYFSNFEKLDEQCLLERVETMT